MHLYTTNASVVSKIYSTYILRTTVDLLIKTKQKTKDHRRETLENAKKLKSIDFGYLLIVVFDQTFVVFEI